MQSACSTQHWTAKHSWQRAPSLAPEPIGIIAGTLFQQAVAEFISCADRLKSSELYRNDLIEFVGQAVGGSIDRHLAEACQAHKSGHADVRDRKARESLEMLRRIDAMVNVRKDRRLETWCDNARSWARSRDEAVFYDSNARLLITYWGWQALSDYDAARVWSGLIRDYYIGRWYMFFKGLAGNVTESVEVWEQSWFATPYVASQPLPVTDLVSEANDMLSVCKTWETTS